MAALPAEALLPTLAGEPAHREAVTVPLTLGGSASIVREESGDRIVVRSRGGTVTLTIELGEAGPKLRFSGADVVLEATHRLSLRAESVELVAERDLVTTVGGDAKLAVGGARHTRITGADRLEAHTLETQANEGEIVLRAREDVRIDAEHIGLNDDPCPGPLPWTAAAEEVSS
jgi:hypothetical protein